MKTKLQSCLAAVFLLAVCPLVNPGMAALHLAISYDRTNLTFNWNGVPGAPYELQGSTNLENWFTIKVLNNPTLTAAPGTITDFCAPLSTCNPLFFRVYSPDPNSNPSEPPQPAPAEPGEFGFWTTPPPGPPHVYLFSGEFHSSATDLRVPGRGLDFVWTRKYRSRIGRNSAQGNSWDFSYNLFVQAVGQDIAVHDGNSRRDVYVRQPNGTFVASRFFREGSFSNGVFVLTFSDTGTWEFRPLDGSPAQGKIARVRDRNANTLTFAYDTSGRLINVNDTLGRNFLINYNVDGFIQSVTDFSGRQVTYTYYQNTDAGGSFGDLRSVTSPIVTNTPNGNNFPAGKTTVYTYSKGSPVEELNHNLLTITDPKGQTWLHNSYATNTSPGLMFDRLERQAIGGSNEWVMLSYVTQTPAPVNQSAVIKAIVNDRMGNVSEYLYDSLNRCVRHRAYTGRAATNVVTTETQNRPTIPLRPDDPPFFETRYAWNADSLQTRVLYPNGNSLELVYESDLNPAAFPRSRANVRTRRHVPGPLGGDQAQIVEQFEYDGLNFVTRHTDARGNVTVHAYDSRGNRTNTAQALSSIVKSFEYNVFGQLTAQVLPDNGSGHRRRDVFDYYATGPQLGYLRQQILDSGRLNLTTTYEYDTVGNRVRVIDPRGNDTLFTVNALNQVVRETSRLVTLAGGPFRYQRTVFYDSNDNVVRVDVQHRNEDGLQPGTTHFSTIYEHDILNQPLLQIDQKGFAALASNVLTYAAIPAAVRSQFVRTAFLYDGNRNRTFVLFPELVAFRDLFNRRAWQFDERNLTLKEYRAEGPLRSTTEYAYDANGNLRRTRQGIESGARETTHAYDGYDRVRSTTDVMGNVTTYIYDANGNPVIERTHGELADGPGSSGNVRLAETLKAYDAVNRCTNVNRRFFNPQNQMPMGDGSAITRTVYSPNSQVIRVIDDNNRATSYSYDTANRLAVVTDAKGNTKTNSYDSNNNRIRLTEVDRSDLGGAAETFTTTYAYDALDRLVRTVDNANNTNRFAYDSRGNRAVTVDPRGNTNRYAYDGLSRLVQTIRMLTDTGDGSGVVTGAVVTSQTWDDSSRLTSQTDPNGNVTRYAYDSLNRRVRTAHADGTTNTVRFDAHDNPIVISNANGTVVFSFYDVLGRLTNNWIIPGPGVAGATVEIYAYDGLGRMVYAEDEDSVVTQQYDSLGNPIQETLAVSGSPTAVVNRSYDSEGNLTRLDYPGGNVVQYTYEALNRPSLIRRLPLGSTIATYSYNGPSRIQRRDYGNGTRSDYSYDAARRLSSVRHWRTNDGFVLDERLLQWDRNNNKQFCTNLNSGETRAYAYDSLDRLISSASGAQGFSLADSGSISPVPSSSFMQYQLDLAGNRVYVSGSQSGAGWYSMNFSLPEPGDFQVNQYTEVPSGSRQYDLSGNLLQSGYRQFTYDYAHRVVQANQFGSQMAYRYDALGRRIESYANGSVLRHYYSGSTEIEERDTSDNVLATYIWSTGSDGLLLMTRYGQDHFYHQDELGSTRVLTDGYGWVVAQYDYSDYGMPQGSSSIVSPYLYKNMRWDSEIQLHHVSGAHLDPEVGRFIQRDPLGLSTTYAGNNPVRSSATCPHNDHDHSNCDKPSRFECGQHYHWWVQNHECNRTAARPIDTELLQLGLSGGGPPPPHIVPLPQPDPPELCGAVKDVLLRSVVGRWKLVGPTTITSASLPGGRTSAWANKEWQRIQYNVVNRFRCNLPKHPGNHQWTFVGKIYVKMSEFHVEATYGLGVTQNPPRHDTDYLPEEEPGPNDEVRLP